MNPPVPIASSAPIDRRKAVEERLRAPGAPEALSPALAALGPVFAEFGRYLSSRIDLLPRRVCLHLAEGEAALASRDRRDPLAYDAGVLEALGGAPGRRFFSFDEVPRAVTRWTQVHYAQLAANRPVVVTIVRPDADRLLESDLPRLPQLAPWLDLRPEVLAPAIDDFARTLSSRLDQVQQCNDLILLAEDARAGGGFDAPVCYPDFSTRHVLTTERIYGRRATHSADRESVARQLAIAWMRQALSGRVVPFDFDLEDVRLRDDRLVLVGGALEPQTPAGREEFLRYLVAALGDDPDAAWNWIAEAAAPDAEGQTEYRLRRRLRQAAPFRDGDWSGDDRLAERLLVQWRVTREAGWTIRPHQLHLYRAVHAVSAATMRLAPEKDILLIALRDERWRLGLEAARPSLDPGALPVEMNALLQDLVRLPQQLDDVLTQAASGRLRVKLHVPDAEEGRRVRNRTVALVASLVTLAGVAFLVRHLAPAYGADVERVGALLLLVIGGWLLVAAARL